MNEPALAIILCWTTAILVIGLPICLIAVGGYAGDSWSPRGATAFVLLCFLVAPFILIGLGLHFVFQLLRTLWRNEKKSAPLHSPDSEVL